MPRLDKRWLHLALLAGLASGCGRIGFDPLANLDGGLGDGDDARPADLIDASMLPDPNSTVLVLQDENVRNPHVAWSGTHLGLAWDVEVGAGSYDAVFARFTIEGVPEGLRVEPGTDSRESSELAWANNQFAFLYTALDGNQSQTFLQMLGDDGSVLVGPVAITSTPHAPRSMSVDYRPGTLAIAYLDTQSGQTMRIATYNDNGVEVNPPTTLDNFGGSSGRPGLAWNGTRYALTWGVSDVTKTSGGFLQLVEADGSAIGSATLYTEDSGASSQLVWNGASFGMLWAGRFGDGGHLSFQEVSEAGALQTPVELIGDTSSTLSPKMIWTGSEYAITWSDNRDGNYEIYYATLNSSGAFLTPPTRLTVSDRPSSSPSIAMTPNGYAIVYTEGARNEGGEALYLVMAPL